MLSSYSIQIGLKLQPLHILIQFLIERMVGHGGLIAKDNEFHAGAGDGDIHSPQVTEESYLPFIVGTDERDEDDIALLSLESIHGVDSDETAIGLEEFSFLHQ